MFNGLFGNSNEHGREGCFGDCTWLILVLLFICCCCKGGNKCFNLRINLCTLIPILALAFCCGGIGMNRD